MKKITLFFAALIVTLGVNAQWYDNPFLDDESGYSYWYDMNTDTWVTDKTPDMDQLFTFALKISSDDFLAYLATAPDPSTAERTIGIHFWTEDNKDYDLRLKKITGDIYGIDFVASQAYAGKSAGGLDVNGQLYFMCFPAQLGGSGWWNNPGPVETWITPLVFTLDGEGLPVTGVNTATVNLPGDVILGDPALPGSALPGAYTLTGIADIIADSQNATVVAYYSILGAKLPSEPENGIFIVVLSNGKTLKLAK